MRVFDPQLGHAGLSSIGTSASVSSLNGVSQLLQRTLAGEGSGMPTP
jgi:hypothetical protein